MDNQEQLAQEVEEALAPTIHFYGGEDLWDAAEVSARCGRQIPRRRTSWIHGINSVTCEECLRRG